jgi:ParB-like chromosome segregation protein Spo0J
MDINQIRPNPNNPRKIDANDFAKLVKSIKDDPKLLTAKPLILDENNVILGGNQRYRACLELGIQDVPVIVMPNLTHKEKQKLLVIDNTHYGQWDMDMLANNDWELTELDDWGVNVDFLVPTIDEPKKIDNTKTGTICPNCGVSL